MCANYKLISRNRAQLLNLLEPTLEYKTDLYPGYGGPILIATEHGIEWRSARFGLVPNWADDIKKVRNTYNARSETVASKPSFRHSLSLVFMNEIEKKKRLMTALECVHQRFGKKKIAIGPCFVPNRNWSMSRDKLSKNPFRWDQLLIINN